MSGDRGIEVLREALRLSPENVPLRRHLAESLLGIGRPDLAEKEFREAVAMAPEDLDLKVGLANAFAQQGKNTLALVILEDVAKAPAAPARAFVAYARLLFNAGDVEQAVKKYRQGIETDPSAADAELGERLGVRAGNEPTEDVDDDVVEGRVRASWESPSDGPEIEVERPGIKFDDVGGMDGVKDEVRMKIIHPLDHPELYRAYGKSIGGGVLLYGPPGCGKTLLARATAGEIRSNFLSVGLNDVREMWIGNSERMRHGVTRKA